MNIYTYFAAVIGALSVITLVGWVVATRLDKRYGTERWHENRFQLVFHPRDTLPRRLKLRAKAAGITPEQLIRQFISEGMENPEKDDLPPHADDSKTSQRLNSPDM